MQLLGLGGLAFIFYALKLSASKEFKITLLLNDIVDA